MTLLPSLTALPNWGTAGLLRYTDCAQHWDGPPRPPDNQLDSLVGTPAHATGCLHSLLCWGKMRSALPWNPSPTAMDIQCQARPLEAWEQVRKPHEQDCTISAHMLPQPKGGWPWYFPTVGACGERKEHYRNRAVFVPLHLLSTLKQEKLSKTARFSGCLRDRTESALLLHMESCHQLLTCCARRGKEPQDRTFVWKGGEFCSHKILQVPGLSWAAIESRQFLT